MKTSDDHSIFAWDSIDPKYPGILAKEPKNFADCISVKLTSLHQGKSAYTITNRGVWITLNLAQWTLHTYLARIHCFDRSKTTGDTTNAEELTGIFLRRLDEDDQYARVKVDGQELQHNIKKPANWLLHSPQYRNHSREVAIYVRQTKLKHVEHTADRDFGFRICEGILETNANGKLALSVIDGKSCQWDSTERSLTVKPGAVTFGNLATLDIRKQGKKIKQIKLCFAFGFSPVVFLAESSAVSQKERVFNKTGQFNINSDYQFSEEERHSAKSLSQRTPHDTLGWSPIAQGRAWRVPCVLGFGLCEVIELTDWMSFLAILRFMSCLKRLRHLEFD
jgi:hypothetical protein